GLLINPEGFAVNEVSNARLYCYGMILYTDAHYLHRVIALQSDKQKTVAQIKQEISHLHHDFSHRSGTRMIIDGRYKFASYFS
ncbi:sulfatase-like hydrolase/transferase, partial [Salmonella enterica subsp. enterica serovar Infantis]